MTIQRFLATSNNAIRVSKNVSIRANVKRNLYFDN